MTGANGQMILILSGQSIPVARADQMKDRATQKVDTAGDYSLQGFETVLENRKSSIDLTTGAVESDEESRKAAALAFFNRK